MAQLQQKAGPRLRRWMDVNRISMHTIINAAMDKAVTSTEDEVLGAIRNPRRR
jgi:hypothetical protein